jgi:hypothetical protein
MYHVLVLIVGMAVSYAGACLMLGPMQANRAIGFGVVCVGLPFIIPVLAGSYLVGRLVLGIIHRLVNVGSSPEEEKEMEANNIRQLARYLRGGRNRGVGDEALRRTMQEAGWRADEVAEAERICARWEDEGRGR